MRVIKICMNNITTANSLIRWLIIFLFIGGALFAGYAFFDHRGGVRNFEDCRDLGGAVLETYPAQCRINGEVFIESIKP
jgi:hypothetical protein